MNAEIEKFKAEIIKIANNALYRKDSSDYFSALFEWIAVLEKNESENHL